MRWFCLFLLLMNGIYAIWHVSYGGTEERNELVNEVSSEGELLKLIEELTADERRELLGDIDISEVSAKLKTPDKCYFVGPFDLVTAEQFVAKMNALDINGILKPRVAEEVSEYMLYLKPAKSLESATKRLNELQDKRIDAFVITEGDLAKGISLGLFKQKKLALELKKKLVGKGYDVKTKELTKQKKEMWAYFSAEDSAKFSPKLWKKISKKNPLVRLEKNVCENSTI